ncbi:MAG: hypothetical protein ABF290_14220 [Thiogranum sp.]
MTTQSLLRFMIITLAAVVAVPAFATGDSPLLETFDKRYEEIIEKSKQGKLSESTASQARELRLSVKKDLIFLDAQIQVYELEVKETSGERQDRAVEHIVNLSAKRERLLIDAVHKLDGMSDGSVTEIPVFSNVEQGKLDADNPQGFGSIRISVEPEDISEPDWD